MSTEKHRTLGGYMLIMTVGHRCVEPRDGAVVPLAIDLHWLNVQVLLIIF